MRTNYAERDTMSADKPDCIYLNENMSCSILRTPRCEGASCAFCRSRSESQFSDEAAVKMLNSLSVEQQRKIASSYYGGKMPWKLRSNRDE